LYLLSEKRKRARRYNDRRGSKSFRRFGPRCRCYCRRRDQRAHPGQCAARRPDAPAYARRDRRPAAPVRFNKPLRRLIEQDRLSSAIFFGPPGCGKSTVAAVIARHTKAQFENFSAVTGGVADVRKIIEAARERKRAYGTRTLLFVDEIHRFNKAQQDAFLPHVEDGTVLLLGATTENPYFAVNAPLLSRSRLFRFEPLTDDDLTALLDRALADEERGLGNEGLILELDARAYLAGQRQRRRPRRADRAGNRGQFGGRPTPLPGREGGTRYTRGNWRGERLRRKWR
jgi:hypothetical protein